MKKKSYSILLFFLGISLVFTTSCLKSDDDKVVIDEEWKALNEARFNEAKTNATLTNELESRSQDGKLYWGESSVITDSDGSNAGLEVSPVKIKPLFRDTVQVRFEIWYFDKDNNKIVAASTENPSYYSGLENPNKISRKVCVGSSTGTTATEIYRFNSSSTTVSYASIDLRTDAWTTLLQDMTVGDERIACAPYYLAYNATAQTYIPAFTTLWYRIKLLKVYPMSALS